MITNFFRNKKKIANTNLIILKISIILLFLLFLNIYLSNGNSINYNHSLGSYYMNTFNLNIIKNLSLNVTSLDYSYSLKYKVAQVKYCINFYDNFHNLIIPSHLLFHSFHVICHMKSKISNNFESIASIYENKYFCCNEYLNIGKKFKFGIKIYNTNSPFKERYKDFEYFLFSDNSSEFMKMENRLFNFKDINHKNDSKFDPLLIKEEYASLENKIISLNNSYQNKINETLSLKKSYMIKPVCSPMTELKVKNNNWTFENIYNHYFCFCKGENCFSKINVENGQRCKYNFYLNIIDINRYLYNKTDYLLADFLYASLSADDAYPIFKEMLKKNLSAHYMTQKKHIYKKYCKRNSPCQIIINEININGEFLEKYLELILRLKAVIVGADLISFDYIFKNIEYITSINLGHGVKYFKSFQYKDYTSPQKYNKLVLAPSKKIIAAALKYGWKEENIIKICLPKWDRYDNIKKNIGQSIFIFFTWRNIRKNKFISSEYFDNIIKLLNNNELNKKLIKKNISLYYGLHHGVFNIIKKMIVQKFKLNYITSDKISDILMKANLLITDFSSVVFDFIYQRKPIIIYIPDSKDPNIKVNYDDD